MKNQEKKTKYIPLKEDLEERLEWKREMKMDRKTGKMFYTGRYIPVYKSKYIIGVKEMDIDAEAEYHGTTDFSLHNSNQERVRKILEDGRDN